MSGPMLQHDVSGFWSASAGHVTAGGQVLLQQPRRAPMPPFQSRRYWPVDEQLEILSQKFHACLLQLMRQGFGEVESRLSLLRNRFDVEAAATELYHAAFIRKLRRASQTTAELGYGRSDVYKCGHKFLQKYQPCLPTIGETVGEDL